jgi:WD40 repeat protein
MLPEPVPFGFSLFSPDSQLALSFGQYQLWDVNTGKVVRRLSLPHRSQVRWGFSFASFTPDGKKLLLAHDRLRLWKVPQPLQGTPERIRLWIEVLTGQELAADGAVVELDAKTWHERRDRLQQLGGPPK